ncbi:hypothetical protein [Marivita sp. GX14005]|uniref:hypothetical protein n=1 Tax=Marivita sp. GX14005 TaxID=2942276 RepID=UPI002018EF27|nr:hypothetical protein [Marivita sp. GX14005]MCL3882785.1 hypothetical protein [Marivita sp. GX14005]
MRNRIGILGVAVILTGCAQLAPEPEAPVDAATRPQSRPAAERRPPASARTAEQFDTTTEQERAAAAQPASAGGASLGTTTASLGDPARPGFWIETPLVSDPGTGRVVSPKTGKSSQVDLIPIDGPKTAGSRLSLAAMRLLEVPLTDLAEVQVFSGG